jgi:hypothetical protein
MATKTFYVTRDMKHPLYRTRMLRAGEQLELDGPTASLYKRLKAVSETPPEGAKVATAPPVTPPRVAPTASKATRKAAPRKRTAKKRATAKK